MSTTISREQYIGENPHYADRHRRRSGPSIGTAAVAGSVVRLSSEP